MLSDKDRELVSIGASIAAGCEPCTNFHLRAAQIAGASNTEIRQAVNEALSVRRDATEGMAQLATQYLGAANSDLTSHENPLIRELVSISAARAINSIADLETHLAAARTLGATKGQILSAIKIASAVKGTAVRKVDAAAARAMGVTPIESEECCGQPEEKVFEQAVSAADDERTARDDCSPQCGCHGKVQS